MSKLSFRARALDATKPMGVYKADEIPDLPDFAAINRAVPQMPTGMEKEEETEHHLQRALSAQQVYGSVEKLVIPIPEVDLVPTNVINKIYGKGGTEFKPPKQYVHVQVAFGMEQEIPDYDLDSEDEAWLQKQAKKMEVTPLQFENMMDRLEKGSGQMVVTLQEAKALLREDDDLIIAVYDYWLNKRLRTQHKLIPTVKTEKRDGSSTSDPYVAFRRRTEKMQTRKNRKNDEVSYEKMLKLRRDLNKALTILELMKRREKSKKEHLQLSIEVYEKRYQMSDWNGTLLAEALAKRHTLPPFIPIQQYQNQWAGKEGGYVRKKREYKKRKHKTSTTSHVVREPQASVQLPQYNEVDVLHTDVYSSEEEGLSPLSPSDHEVEDDPDGIYAFRRKANCVYQAPINEGLGNWPWTPREEGGLGDPRYRYCLTSLSAPRRCVGFARRRYGRGGRLLLDRGFTEWDDHLTDLDFSSNSTPGPTHLATLLQHIKDNRYSHFRPRTPTEEEEHSQSHGALTPADRPSSPEFSEELYHTHQQQLLAMQRQQQETLLKHDTAHPDLDTSFDMDQSFSSQPTSRFTLDSASARFAASAVCSSRQPLLVPHAVSGASCSTVVTSMSTLPNGPLAVDSKAIGLSTSPQASVLQLNFPLSSVSGPTSLASSSPATLTTSLLPPAPSSIASTRGISLATASSSTPVIAATRAAAPAGTSAFKLVSTPSTKADIITKDRRDGVNSLVTDSIVAMEVT